MGVATLVSVGAGVVIKVEEMMHPSFVLVE